MKSMYRAIVAVPGLKELLEIWKIRLPLKIRVFLWQLVRGRLPSGIEVLKRSGPGDGTCPLCDAEEQWRS